ncbi:thioredoxin family protein [Vaginella massiliensis]|uniref:thioredoxin family protein n=1 Tax=Vaginella massiliensis TaxID=1816680 RepID=UPI0008392BC0|nr:thioredoxin family protein [Vaginella massiliensis]
MKKILAISVVALALLILNSCEGNKVMNRVVKYEHNGTTEMILLGEFEKSQLLTKNFKSWYEEEYNSYPLDSEKIARLKKYSKDYSMEIFLGTWCPDSQREVPAMLKILEAINFPDGRMKLYGVNRDKKSFYGEEMNKDIRWVPTFIIYEKRQEIGRIVESPSGNSLEEDLLKIFSKEDYTPNYAED